MDNIFFGANGLSSTSANHIANMAKESYEGITSELENIQFYDRSLKLLDSSEKPYIISRGVTDLSKFEKLLEEKAHLQSLIAWLREAIKAKNAITEKYRSMTYENIAKELNLEVPAEPEQTPYLTEDDCVSNLSVKERNRYLYLNTICATLGKFIHPDGKYSKERKLLAKFIQNPNDVTVNGHDTLITSYTPSVTLEEVDNEFFELQSKHRAYQAEYNGMKHKIEMQIDESIEKSDAEYNVAFSEYRTKLKEFQKTCESWRSERLKEARDLKIVIPNDLNAIYQKVNALGK